MKHLTYLLLWLSVLTFGHAAYAIDGNAIGNNAIGNSIGNSSDNNFVTATPAAPLPAAASNPPVRTQDGQNSELPPPPPGIAPAAMPPAGEQFASGTAAQPSLSSSTGTPQPGAQPAGTLNGGTLDFGLARTGTNQPVPDPAPAAAAELPPVAAPSVTVTASPALDALFAGNENSLVAKAVGAAEGTRTPDGGRNPAYYGHTDPGNGVWNLGSFSYQHAATSPEDADAKQLARLRRQADQILQKATDKGFSLTLTEKLNGIDLANQAPLAALGHQGYVDWLAVAKSEGKAEADAVLSARVRSFIDPRTQQWDAPGLGNSEDRITRDQARRMAAIDRAIFVNQQQIAQMPQTNSGEDQLFSQQGEPPFNGVKPRLENSKSSAGAIAEAPNTDDIIGFEPSSNPSSNSSSM